MTWEDIDVLSGEGWLWLILLLGMAAAAAAGYFAGRSAEAARQREERLRRYGDPPIVP